MTEQPYRRLFRAVFILCVCLGVIVVTLAVPDLLRAEDVSTGTVLSKENWQAMKSKTFHGHRIEDLVTAPVLRQIQEYGLRLKLADRISYKPPEPWKKASQQNVGNAELVPVEGHVSDLRGYNGGGVPFPDVSEDDPMVGEKVLWNSYYGYYMDPVQVPKTCYMTFVDQGGVSRWTKSVNAMFDMTQNFKTGTRGMYWKGGPNSKVRRKRLLFVTYPQDVRGLGSFSIRYRDGRFDDTWIYIRSLRRTRRVSGGTWTDPSPTGAHVLNDENYGTFGHPTWYKDVKYVGTKTILSPYYYQAPFHENAPTIQQQLKFVNMKEPPYWNLSPEVTNWQPFKVHVIEQIMPEKHPYSKRRLYVREKTWEPLQWYGYDKNGNLWRSHWYVFQYIKGQTDPENSYPVLLSQLMIDVKKEESSPVACNFVPNPEGIQEGDFRLERLKRANPFRVKNPPFE